MSNNRIYLIMKKIISIFIFSLSIFLILINSYEIMDNIRFSFSLCINTLFPSLIPFMLLSNILINYNFVNDISDILGKITTKLFKVNKNCSFALIMSILSGTPSNAKYLKDLYDNSLINLEDIRKCLNFCHFTNPIFILGTIGYTFLNNKKLGLVILVSHYISSIIIGFFNKKNRTYNTNCFKQNNDKKNFIDVFKDSINNTITTLFLILGIITTCIIITCIINKIIPLKDNYKFIYGLLEVTQGLKYLSLSSFSLEFKTILSSFLISFGGVCIHSQVFSILDNKKIRYLPYLISRIIHGFLSSFISLILLYIN